MYVSWAIRGNQGYVDEVTYEQAKRRQELGYLREPRNFPGIRATGSSEGEIGRNNRIEVRVLVVEDMENQ
jgi:hypothetical protein